MRHPSNRLLASLLLGGGALLVVTVFFLSGFVVGGVGLLDDNGSVLAGVHAAASGYLNFIFPVFITLYKVATSMLIVTAFFLCVVAV